MTEANWKPRIPTGALLRVVRKDANGAEHIAWVGFVDRVVPDGDEARMTAHTVVHIG